MELHSYAKLRGYKKWTIEQKRKLVEARINYDGIFSRKSSNCVESWKKIMAAAKLNDFNVCFVRKQWANLLARYKAYKRTRLRQLGKSGKDLNDQIAREISEEWEFFYPLHSFMSQKVTDFHSYAQTPRAAMGGSSDNSHAEDDDEFKPTPAVFRVNEESKQSVQTAVPQNTDHDFYSKSASREIINSKQSPPSAAPTLATNTNNITVLAENANSIKQPKEEEKEEKVQTLGSTASAKKKKKRKPSERDKYYKHKRRYDRRNERRYDALLHVFGQVIKEHYPNVDTSRLAAQSEQVSTEDEGSMLSMCSEDSESTCTAASLASAESGL